MLLRDDQMRRSRTGFTLVEVMAAFVLAAIVLTFVSVTSSSAVVNAGRAYRMNVAAMLMRAAVLDIEEEFTQDGFPTNDQTRKRCDLPKQFDRTYRCEYDLQGLDIDPGTMSEMATAAIGNLMGGIMPGGPGGDSGGGRGAGAKGGSGPDLGDTSAMVERLGGMVGGGAATTLAMVAANPMLMEVCQFNLEQALTNTAMAAGFFPMIVEKAAEVTRKLTVRISWAEDRSRNRRELVVETFIVAVPEDQEEFMKSMGRAEDMGILPQGGPGGLQNPAIPDPRGLAPPAGGGR